MSTRIIKKCPKCQAVYENKLYNGKPSKYNQQQYGSPVQRCKKCGSFFIDKDFREIAISGPRQVDTWRVSPQTMVYGGFSLLFGIFSLAVGLWWGAILLIVGVLLIFFEARGYKGRLEYLEEERKKSEERVKSPGYVEILKEIGYEFPNDYFDKKEVAEDSSEESI